MLRGRPAAHVGADLRDEAEGVVGPDAVDLGQVDASELVQRGAEIVPRFVFTRFLAATRSGEWCAGWGGGSSEPSEVGLDGDVARRELALIGVEQLEVLLQDEDVLRAVVACEGGRDFSLGGLTAMVAMLGEVLRVPVAGQRPGGISAIIALLHRAASSTPSARY